MLQFKDYFYGNKISDYGRQNGRVDYATFSKAFEAVLNNDIMSKTWGLVGEWEQVSGFIDNSEEIEEVEAKIDDVNKALFDIITKDPDEYENSAEYIELKEELEELETRKEELEEEENEPGDIFQWYIIDENGARICEEFDEIVYYNDALDMYLWGVTHYGTSWSYVLTSIPCEIDETAKA